MQVAYLADMFGEINSLNILMLSRDQTLLGLSEKLKAFKEKQKLRINKIKAGETASFPTLNAFLEVENFLSPKSKTFLRNIYSNLLQILTVTFQKMHINTVG